MSQTNYNKIHEQIKNYVNRIVTLKDNFLNTISNAVTMQQCIDEMRAIHGTAIRTCNLYIQTPNSDPMVISKNESLLYVIHDCICKCEKKIYKQNKNNSSDDESKTIVHNNVDKKGYSLRGDELSIRFDNTDNSDANIFSPSAPETLPIQKIKNYPANNQVNTEGATSAANLSKLNSNVSVTSEDGIDILSKLKNLNARLDDLTSKNIPSEAPLSLTPILTTESSMVGGNLSDYFSSSELNGFPLQHVIDAAKERIHNTNLSDLDEAKARELISVIGSKITNLSQKLDKNTIQNIVTSLAQIVDFDLSDLAPSTDISDMVNNIDTEKWIDISKKTLSNVSSAAASETENVSDMINSLPTDQANQAVENAMKHINKMMLRGGGFSPKKPSLILVSTDWCPFSQKFLHGDWLKIKDELTKLNKDVQTFVFDVIKTDALRNKYAEQLGVNGFPMLVFVHNGKIHKDFEDRSVAAVVKKINEKLH